MLKAYKYRLYPTKTQEVLLAKHFGCARYIYNYGLERKIKSYSETKKSVSRFTISADLPKLKKSVETKWLSEVSSLSLQAALLNLDMAFTRFFKERKGFPKFKSKHDNRQSFQVPQNVKVDYDAKRVFLPKFREGIKCRFDRQFSGKIKTSTVSRTPTGKYFISILVETEDSIPNKAPIDENKAVGVDLGIKTFATLSDGTEIQNPKYLKKALKRLKRLQRSVSRKKKGSNRRKKAVKLLARQYEKVADKRKDFLHKTSKYLIDRYDTICLETLSASNMMKNHRLAQALSDIGIGAFNAYMDYSAHAFEYTRYSNLLNRILPQSDLYEYVFRSQEAMYWASGTQTEYNDLRYENFHMVSPYCFVCTVIYSADMTAKNWYEQYSYKLENAYELAFVSTNGRWLAAGMNVITGA